MDFYLIEKPRLFSLWLRGVKFLKNNSFCRLTCLFDRLISMPPGTKNLLQVNG